MAILKVVVPLLNKRTAPVEDTGDVRNVIGQVNDKFQFESVEEKTISSVTWYKDKQGNWYWGGGLSLSLVKNRSLLLQNSIPFSNTEPNASWLNALCISDLWKITKGDSCNIAVLDSGINLENDQILNNVFSKNNSKDFSKSFRNFLDDGTNVMDQFGHGSHCASIISSQNNQSIIGIAPEAKLFIGKISAFGELRGYQNISKGILWASDIKEVDIISISFGLNGDDPSFDDLVNSVKYAISKNKIIIAAIGDIELNPNPLFPALFENCISVGACDSTFNEWEGNAKSDKTVIYAPGKDIFSFVVKNDFFSDDPHLMTGSSQATAITSGIVALIISYLKQNNKKYNYKIIKEILQDNCQPLKTDEKKKGIDPIKIFLNI